MAMVKDRMTKDVVSIDAEESVYTAAKLMKDKQVSSIIVTRNTKPIGIFTERDMVWRVAGEAKDPKATRMVEVMSSPLISVTPVMTLEDASDVLSMSNVKKLAVVSGDRLEGIISATDILAAQTKDLKLMGRYIEIISKDRQK